MCDKNDYNLKIAESVNNCYYRTGGNVSIHLLLRIILCFVDLIDNFRNYVFLHMFAPYTNRNVLNSSDYVS